MGETGRDNDTPAAGAATSAQEGGPDGTGASGGTPRRPRQPRQPRKPKPITRGYLENVALWYLGRFAATAKGLETVLMRRVHRSARHHGADPAEGAELVAAIIQRYRESGLLNDAAFAEARARTLHDRGLPVRAIALKLRQKGVAPDDIDAAIAALAETRGADDVMDPADSDRRALDREAAWSYARRRRLGPYRAPERRAEMRERDLAAMARAGFSYGIARDVIGDDTG